MAIPIRQAVLWVRDTAFDLWQLLHPPKHSKPRPEQPSNSDGGDQTRAGSNATWMVHFMLRTGEVQKGGFCRMMVAVSWKHKLHLITSA